MHPFGMCSGFLIPPWPTFPQAPLSSRTVGFPESGWQQWHFPCEPSRPIRRLSVRPHTPLDWTVISPARLILEILFPGSVPGTACPKVWPPFTESPFARSRHYPLRCDLLSHMGRHYPFVLATSSSCARPKSSPGLSFPLYRESLQVVANPCWKLALPDVISANPSPRVWTLTPAAPVVHLPVSSHRTSAFPPRLIGRRLA